MFNLDSVIEKKTVVTEKLTKGTFYTSNSCQVKVTPSAPSELHLHIDGYYYWDAKGLRELSEFCLKAASILEQK